MSDLDLEARLARYGDAIDELADAPTPTRANPAPTTLVVETARVRRPSYLPLVAAFVVLAVIVAALLVVRRLDQPAPAHPAPTWEKLDARAAGFAPHSFATCCARIGDRLVAYGQVTTPPAIRGSSTSRAAIWTSDDGRHWARAHTPTTTSFVSDVVSLRGRTFAFFSGPDLGSYWTTKDGRRWTAVTSATLANHESTEVDSYTQVVSIHGRLVLLVVPMDVTTGPALLTSKDGRDWSELPAPPPVSSIQPFRGGLLALGRPTSVTDAPQTWFSENGTSWTRLVSNLPPRAASLTVPEGQHDAYVIQYEAPGTFGGRLWRSHDGANWTEVTTFHDAFPVANPDHLVHVGGWWILGGNTGSIDGLRRSDLWWSRDLDHWAELAPALRGTPSGGSSVAIGSNDDAVVGLGISPTSSDHAIWRWDRS